MIQMITAEVASACGRTMWLAAVFSQRFSPSSLLLVSKSGKDALRTREMPRAGIAKNKLHPIVRFGNTKSGQCLNIFYFMFP